MAAPCWRHQRDGQHGQSRSNVVKHQTPCCSPKLPDPSSSPSSVGASQLVRQHMVKLGQTSACMHLAVGTHQSCPTPAAPPALWVRPAAPGASMGWSNSTTAPSLCLHPRGLEACCACTKVKWYTHTTQIAHRFKFVAQHPLPSAIR
jgi:hypothetical protein